MPASLEKLVLEQLSSKLATSLLKQGRFLTLFSLIFGSPVKVVGSITEGLG